MRGHTAWKEVLELVKGKGCREIHKIDGARNIVGTTQGVPCKQG